LEEIFLRLESQGIRCHFGRWLIEGEPQVILIDFSNLWPGINNYKFELWNLYKIDSMESGFEFDEPVVWSWGVAKLVEQLQKTWADKKWLFIAMNG